MRWAGDEGGKGYVLGFRPHQILISPDLDNRFKQRSIPQLSVISFLNWTYQGRLSSSLNIIQVMFMKRWDFGMVSSRS